MSLLGSRTPLLWFALIGGLGLLRGVHPVLYGGLYVHIVRNMHISDAFSLNKQHLMHNRLTRKEALSGLQTEHAHVWLYSRDDSLDDMLVHKLDHQPPIDETLKETGERALSGIEVVHTGECALC
eukprot:m.41021 g.41021  ORF g.41021 m.41021 type:complete len:125 (+) comp46098_c0_seq5:179-553(+)